MGRYRSTVRCSHCWKEGHNVKSCSQLTEEVKANPGGRAHRRYSKYFDEEGNRKDASSARSCSYCNEIGHTKRTCETKLNDLVYNIKTNQEYRNDVYAWFKKKGLGVGSLVTIYGNMYLVTQINWDEFTCGDQSWNKHHLYLEPLQRSSRTYTKFYLEDSYMRPETPYPVIQVDSEVEVAKPAAEWFEGRSEFYREHKGRVTNVLHHYSPF